MQIECTCKTDVLYICNLGVIQQTGRRGSRNMRLSYMFCAYEFRKGVVKGCSISRLYLFSHTWNLIFSPSTTSNITQSYSEMSTTTQAVQVISISTAFLASGGIAAFSFFDIPELKSQPASRFLPSVRWFFSRGSHIFPQAAALSSTGFAYLCYNSIPHGSQFLQSVTHGKPALYLAAAALTISIAPFTTLVMVPTNFELIKMNEKLGGSRSAASAEYRQKAGSKQRSADESVASKDDVSQWKDLSGPMEKTQRESSKEEDEEASALLDKFGVLNNVRALLMAAGGIVGLMGALAL